MSKFFLKGWARKLVLPLLFLPFIHWATSVNQKHFLRTAITQSFVDLKVGGGSVIYCRPYKSGDGYIVLILTANHLSNKENKIPLRFPTFDKHGKITAYDYYYAKRIFCDKENDFMILKVKINYYIKPVKVCLDQLNLMDEVYEIGRPNSSAVWITKGEVACLNAGDGLFGHNANSYLGNSGGPVFNLNGKQIGIASSLSVDDYLPIFHMTKSVSIIRVKQVLGSNFRKYFNG